MRGVRAPGVLLAGCLLGGLVLAGAWLAPEAPPGGTVPGLSFPREERREGGAPRGGEPSGARPHEASTAPADPRATERGPIEVGEIAPGAYAIHVRGLRGLLDDPRRALGSLVVRVSPWVGAMGRPGIEISSDLVDGVLTRDGLAVTDPKALGLAGVETGDILRTVNGHPVAHLRLVLVELRREPGAGIVRLELDRAGARITRAYEIRGI